MTDEEIKTKRLSDWKPETDIKLQKAFGKFVEEGGELLDAIYAYSTSYDNASDLRAISSLEDEFADCQAVVVMIENASDGLIDVSNFDNRSVLYRSDVSIVDRHQAPLFLGAQLGKTLNIIGRCQIQGLKGQQPETKALNSDILEEALTCLSVLITELIEFFHLDKERINNRTQAKIHSKLPWVMGTATDLLPDQSSCEHDWEYNGTDRAGSRKGEDAYVCRKCGARKYEQ